MTGKVVKGIGGFYFVNNNGEIIMGKARGNLKRNKDIIYVGDMVDFDIADNNECIINSVIQRNNYLTRPPVSNLEMLVVVFAAANPDVNYPVIDKLILACEAKNIDVTVCINKKDLVSEQKLSDIESTYKNLYPTVSVNAVKGEGIRELRDIIKGKSVALAGPSGVGKSTITNMIIGESCAETGTISEKTLRGRHTTRHVEIFVLDDGTMLYDTPGFTSMDLPDNEVIIGDLFPEFRSRKAECRYRDCKHINEPDCAVKEALIKGEIKETRYESYKLMIEEGKKWQR